MITQPECVTCRHVKEMVQANGFQSVGQALVQIDSLKSSNAVLLNALERVAKGTEWMTEEDFEFIRAAIAKAKGAAQ